MLEILFTESAAGSMKYAKNAHHHAIRSTCAVFLADDSDNSALETASTERSAVEENRRNKIINTVPMEGSPRDVACFPLILSIGDISDPMSDRRAASIQSTVLIPGSGFDHIGQTLVDTARESLNAIRSALDRGEPIRIWYSQNPDELCGFCHLLTILPKTTDIRIVELPAYETGQNRLITYTGWGDVDPLELGRLQCLERPLSDMERRRFAGIWRKLEQENGALRAVVNGRLCTVGADFYDYFILRELERQPERFHEARLIGEILGKYQLGIGDSLVALRIEALISQGMLIPDSEPEPECPIYHRLLKKSGHF